MKKNFLLLFFNVSFTVLFAVLGGFTNPALAEVGGLNCIQIEGLNLGCVSSVDHVCKMNKASDSKVADCAYGGGWSARWRVEGPIAFACKSYKVTTTEILVPAKGCGVPGDTCIAAHIERITSSECEENLPPVCQESCSGCYEDVQTFPTGISRGCTICTRQRCADEPPTSNFCPERPPMALLGSAKKCSTDERCPKTVQDPISLKYVPVTIKGPSSCSPGPAPTSAPGVIGKYCPWKLDQRTGGSVSSDGNGKASAGNCECITEDNWNTNLGPWPGCPKPAGP